MLATRIEGNMVVMVAIMDNGNTDVGNKNRGKYGCYGGNYGQWQYGCWQQE